jgi:hypothetical protein
MTDYRVSEPATADIIGALRVIAEGFTGTLDPTIGHVLTLAARRLEQLSARHEAGIARRATAMHEGTP